MEIWHQRTLSVVSWWSSMVSLASRWTGFCCRSWVNFSAACSSEPIGSTSPTSNVSPLSILASSRYHRRVRQWDWPPKFFYTWHPASSCSSSSRQSCSRITRDGPTMNPSITPLSLSRPSVSAISWRVSVLSYRFLRCAWNVINLFFYR